MSGGDHNCFGCGRSISDQEPHIHVPMDEWAVSEGLPALGMDDILTFPFCSQCIEKADHGWQEHAHRTDSPA